MTLVSFSDVAVEFGAVTILERVTFTVARGERWGIVGRNGAGKTTLFKLITGAVTPARGAVAKMPGLRIALLDQHRDFGDAATVWEAAASGYGDVLALERSLARQAERLAELGERATEADLTKFGHDQERFAHAGGYDFHARVDAVLQGLGFDADGCKTRPVSALSGGERGRVAIASSLAAPADLVLLDEPTNHLDLDTTRWLATYLGELGETVLVISHDRAFLDDTADHIAHVANRSVTAYRGGYSAFVQQRAERELAQQRVAEKQQAFIAKEEDYIRRNIAGQNTAQAKGRRKRLERLPRLSPPPGEAGAMSLRLEISERGGDRVVDATDLTVAIDHRVLLTHVTAGALRGEVVAVIGPNGAGKTTLLSTLLGAREPAGGELRIGASIAPAWYRQDLAGVPLDRSIYDVILDLRPLWTRGQIQGHLGAFGFSGDEVLRMTNSLSGGERARVALAMITLQRANLLVLDEPTNHLDVESIEALEDAIDDYEGSVILVSHDRAFLRELATRVWVIANGTVEDFTGSFVEWEVAAAEREGARAARHAEDAAARKAAERAKSRRSQAAADSDSAMRRAHRRKLEDAERAVHAADKKVTEINAALQDPALYDGSAGGAKRARELGRQLAAARAAAEEAMRLWEAVVADSVRFSS
ncbi:MAG TPA: ABC-F family ATP-binding cassette domain-containing protein [Gemmatimonadaceae bacterium]|nr:ABC-F family ATP-binding cassette domain-containing protein [Gemmatimonadaceae bacterium]